MPRGLDPFRVYVEVVENNKWKCRFCGNNYGGSATRIRAHLAGIPGYGIKGCEGVDGHVRAEALKAIKGKGSVLDISTGGISGEGAERIVFGASQIVFRSDYAWNPNDTQNSNQPGCAPQRPSCYWQTGNGAASACPRYRVSLPPGNMPMDNLDTTQQPDPSNHRLDAVHGNEIASSLQQLSMDSPALSSLDPRELTALLDQPTHLETGDEQQNSRGLSPLQYDQVLGNSTSNGLQEFIAVDVLPDPRLSNITATSIPQYSNEQCPSSDEQFADGITPESPLYSTDWSNLFDSLQENLVESRDVYVNTSEEIQMNELHNPTVGSSLQNDSSLDVDSANGLQASQPCIAEVVPVLSPTNTVQHPDQIHPWCNKEYGNDTRSFPSQTPMDIDPLIASQHTSDSQIFEATIVDLQVPEVATNTTGPSLSSGMNRGSPIMNVQSIYANDEEIRNLKRKVEELHDKEAVIKEQVEIDSAASSVRKKPRILVEKWLKETERARNNFQIIGQTNAETLPPKEQVETLTREVEELIERTLPQTLLIEVRDAKGDAFLERKLIGEEINRNIELIWDCLKENHVCKLGIYGMGGAGKTTIMMHIHNRLLKDATFDGVLFIRVSQDFSIYKLQSDIWKALKFGVMEDGHEKKRAAMLSECLERKKNCVLILDDVWQHFKLQDVGIPDRAGLKVVLTTRFSEVCSRMDCEEIKIQPLGEEEAWKLFMEELGPKPLTNTQVEKVARKIANRCVGLPLAINTMASSLRGEKNFFVWQDTLNKLDKSHTKHTEMGDKVLPVLTLSYERLSDPQVKQCFLFCALFPEDERIDQMELIEYFIDEGFLDELDTREAQYYRGLAIVDMLRKACLLEVDYEYDYIRMHDLIREMALHIRGTTYMVKVGWDLRSTPNREYWTEDLEKVFLMGGYVEDILPDMLPNCPKLSTLLLNESRQLKNMQLQDSFFMKLRGLKVLNLSGCAISELPDSVSELANLKALLLINCWLLHRIPYLGKLKSLRKLDAYGCESLLAVEGLEELRNLRYLDLAQTGIERSSEGTFRRMTNLQYLKIEGKVKAEDVIQLKALERLDCNFGNVDDFNKYVRFMERSGCHDYSLIVDPEKSLWFVTAYYSDPGIFPENKINDDDYRNYPKSVEIRSCNSTMTRVGEERNNDSILIPRDVEFFVGTNCRGMTDLSGMGLLRCLRELDITGWNNLVVLFGGAGVDEEVRRTQDSPVPLFPSLETLKIGRCTKLKYLIGHESIFSLPLLREIIIYECEGIEGMTTSVASPPQLGGPAFTRLEHISVENCGNMKRVVGSEWLPHFPNLRMIAVKDCNNIRELLPQECLHFLPKLEYIYVGFCEGIQEIISGGGENHGESAPLNTPSSSLPSPFSPFMLKCLYLFRLPQLKSICEGALSFVPDAFVKVNDCPKLKTIPPRQGHYRLWT